MHRLTWFALVILVAVSPCTVGAAQTKARPGKATGASQTSWIKRFPVAYLDTAWSAVVTRDGNLVVGIQSMRKDDTPNRMHFVKLDLAGKPLWRADLPPAAAGNAHQSCEIPIRLREAADGSLLVAGTRCNHTFTTYFQSWPYAWFARLDGQGKPLWEVAPDRGATVPANQGMPQSYGWDIVEWPDGGVLGMGLHTGGMGYALWRLDLGADGALRRQRSDENMGFDEYWRGIWSAGVVDRGARIGFSTLERRGDARVGWLGRDLAFLDSASLASADEEELYGLSAAPDGGYCLLYKRGWHYLRRHGGDDRLLWERQLQAEPSTRLLALRDGGCLLAGGIESGGSGLRLARFDAGGQALWTQALAGRMTPKSLLETPTGGLVVTGYESPPDFRGSMAYVLHIAANDLGKAGVKPARR